MDSYDDQLPIGASQVAMVMEKISESLCAMEKTNVFRRLVCGGGGGGDGWRVEGERMGVSGGSSAYETHAI